jgi:predicted DNA-binding helix-hairpin-helix protein
VTLDLLERADLLGGDARFDLCAREGRSMPAGDGTAAGGGPVERRYRHGDIRRHISLLQHPTKGPMPVLKMLQTNACANDCFYCPCRAGRDFRREAFGPDELARLTDQLYRARVIQGLFLSSGVVGHGDYSMERIVATGEILRRRYDFPGYLHLKIMPAASDEAIARAIAVADRVSINLEAPTPAHLARITSTKDLPTDLIDPLRRAQAIAAAAGRKVSRTTQYVVGAAGESDADILTTTERLYREVGLARAYYSAFHPVPNTPLDGLPPEDPRRQHRLYQADFLLRHYRFGLDDLAFDPIGRLDLREDPKLTWARRHPEAFPVEINRAGRAALLRVPGFGPRSVDAVLAARRLARIRDVSALRRIGVHPTRALPWVTIDGRTPPRQIALPEVG